MLESILSSTLRRFWSRWTDVLVIVKPETVIGWHRAGFRLYWRWRSRLQSPANQIMLRTLKSAACE